jgi:hypothetical protein
MNLPVELILTLSSSLLKVIEAFGLVTDTSVALRLEKDAVWAKVTAEHSNLLASERRGLKAIVRLGKEYAAYLTTFEEDIPPFPVTPDKVYLFMRQQAIRPQRRRTGPGVAKELPGTTLSWGALESVSAMTGSGDEEV